MGILTPPMYVDPPNPLRERYGLFTVATGPLDLPVHARTGGVEYEPGTCDKPYGYEIACSDLAEKVFDAGVDGLVTGTPFAVLQTLSCGSMGMDEARYRAALLRALKANEQATVEDIFSRGTVGQSPSLANNSPNATTLTAAANVVRAVGQLEQWWTTTRGSSQVGVIHVPAIMASEMMSQVLVWLDGNIWRTGMGNAVSFGNYSALDADGDAPASGHTTLYMTGQVVVWRTPDSDVFFPPMEGALDRTTNQINAVVEREYVVAYDCAAAAIDVTL